MTHCHTGAGTRASAGLTAEPCLAAFDGIFAVVAGHPSREPGPQMTAYEVTKLESILAIASGHAEYGPYMAALQFRLGAKALWEHIFGKDLDHRSLRWLMNVQVHMPICVCAEVNVCYSTASGCSRRMR